MTQQEIIEFIERVIETNPNGFSPDIPIIEDNYICVPSVEFKRDPNTNKWIPI